MAYMRLHTLLVLTLLQLSLAEIPNSLPESWYSANVINEGFHPKPISEIFTTPSPFSSANPIVVLSTASAVRDEIDLLSTLPPRTSNVFSSEGYTFRTRSTPLPPTVQTVTPQIITQAQEVTRPQVQTLPPQLRPELPIQPQPIPEIQVQSEPPPTFITESTPTSEFSTIPQFQTQPQTPVFSTFAPTTLSTPQPNIQQAILPQNPFGIDLPQTQIVQRPVEFANPPTQVQAGSPGSLPNYIMIYQQAPQFVQSDIRTSRSSEEMSRVTSSIPTLPSSTPFPTVITQRSTVSIQPRPIVSTPSSPTAPPTSTTVGTIGTSRVTVTPSLLPHPCNTGLQQSYGTFPLPLKIRVVAPSGSITNVRFNPITTTTKAPTTTRTRKPKKNTYGGCLDGCRSNRKQICAIPLSSKQIDPDALKGFPSVCHMACHNSYKKDAYEQLIEGRCGKLRTRIRTVGSNTKLRRDELNKAQYFVDDGRPQTVVEFSGAIH